MYEIERLPQSIDIGYTGEMDFHTVQIDMSEWVAKMPEGQPTLMHIRPGEYDPYPVTITYENNIITWSVTDGDLGTSEGTGLLQVWFGVQDETEVMRQLGMSVVVPTIIHLSIAGEGRNSSTVQIPWLKEVMEMKNLILGYDYEAESWANGQRGGEDVGSDDQAYHNNAKYYKEQVEDMASDAEAFAAGTRGGEAVDEDDPAYHNNASYYNDQAALEKAAAQAAAETASAAYNVNLLAANYDATKTYAVGEYVIYSGGLYRCISAITTAEAWTAAHWSSVTVGKDTSALKSAISELDEMAKLTSGISDTYHGVTFSLESSDTLKVYGTATATRRVLCLNGQNKETTSSTAFEKTFDPGIYEIETQITGALTDNIAWAYTYTTFASALLSVTKNAPVGTFSFDQPVMFGLSFSTGTNFGTSDNPTYIKISVKKINVKGISNYLSGNSADSVDVPSGANFNDYTTPGSYRVTSGAIAQTIINRASDSNGRLFVFKPYNDTRIIQMYFQTGETLILVRRYTTAWSDWTAIVTADVMSSNAMLMRGNVVSLGYTTFAACTAPGVYVFTTGNLASITDKPDGLDAGGMLITTVNGTTAWQEIHSSFETFIRYGFSGTWQRQKDSLYVKYSTDAATDNDDAQISIDIPKGVSGKKIRYKMGHCADADSNADVWRLMYMYYVLSNGTATQMNRHGEFECALHLNGRDDFSGGITHGDEIDQNVTFLMDGQPVTASNANGFCKEFRIIRNSILYDPADHTTAIAEHGCEYIYTAEGLTINQSIKWLVAEPLTNCFLAMLPIYKTFSTYRYDDVSFVVTENTGSSYSVTVPGATSVTEYNADVSTTMEVPKYPTGLTGGDCALITDNNGNSYNKVYFVVCTGGNSSINELWKSKTVFKCA